MCSLHVSSLVGAFGPLRTLQAPAAYKPPLRELCSHSSKAWTLLHQVCSAPSSLSAVTSAPGSMRDHTAKQWECESTTVSPHRVSGLATGTSHHVLGGPFGLCAETERSPTRTEAKGCPSRLVQHSDIAAHLKSLCSIFNRVIRNKNTRDSKERLKFCVGPQS